MVAGMRVFLPCPSCCIPGQVGEDKLSHNNCTYPNRKAGSCEKGAREAQSRRLWHSPFLTAVSGSNMRRGTTSWKPHISAQLYLGLEAAGSCWYDPPRTKHLNRLNGSRGRNKTCFKSFTWSVSLPSLSMSSELQYERDKSSLHVCLTEEVWNWYLSSGQQCSLLTKLLLLKIFISQKQQGLRRKSDSRFVFSNTENQK